MKKNDYTIRMETPADYRAVENLTREAFWNVYRPGCAEHYVLHTYRSRAEFIPQLSLVMEVGGTIISHIIYSKAQLLCDDGRIVPMVTAGPLSIHPDYRRQGYGLALLTCSMEKAAQMGYGCLCFEGNIDFYRHIGCVVASTRGIHYYAKPRESEVPYFLCKELLPRFLDGISATYHTPEGYFLSEEDTEAFDAQFPPKVKLKLPGQLF